MLLTQSLADFREFYQFLRYNKHFYVINSPTQICLINTIKQIEVINNRGISITDYLPIDVKYDLAKLPPHIYLAWYIPSTSDSYMSLSNRQSGGIFQIFDIDLPDKTYEQRITILQLYNQEIENNSVSVLIPHSLTIVSTLDNLQIWNLLNSHGSSYLLKSHNSYFRDKNIIKPKVSITGAIVVSKGNLSIDVKYNNQTYTITTGLTKDDYYSINIKDNVVCAFTRSYGIYISKKQ